MANVGFIFERHLQTFLVGSITLILLYILPTIYSTQALAENNKNNAEWVKETVTQNHDKTMAALAEDRKQNRADFKELLNEIRAIGEKVNSLEGRVIKMESSD